MNRHYRSLTALALVLGLCISAGCPQRDRAKQQERRQAAQPARQAAATATASAPSQPALRRVHVLVTGRVQGVGFRAFTRTHALELKLTGWVMNLSDGRVEAVIEGAPDKVDKLLTKIRTGPPAARVDDVETTEGRYSGQFETFAVKFEGR
jgi:acylphosphatase